MPLVRRTTRSVHLTEAGERLYSSVRPALDEVRAAVAAVGELGDQPRGTLRVHTASAAETLIGESFLAGFLAEYPYVQLDLVVSDAPVDIVAEGFDAGIQLGEVIDKDMIAVPVTGDLRLAVVGAPSYFARRGRPTHPRELTEHDCLNWHPTTDTPPYRWEFTENGRRLFGDGAGARALDGRGAQPAPRDRGVGDHDVVRGARARRPRAGPARVRYWRSFARRSPGTTCTIRSGGARRARCGRWSSTSAAGTEVDEPGSGTASATHDVTSAVPSRACSPCGPRSHLRSPRPSVEALGRSFGPRLAGACCRHPHGLTRQLLAGACRSLHC